jgi:hypothetical protein
MRSPQFPAPSLANGQESTAMTPVAPVVHNLLTFTLTELARSAPTRLMELLLAVAPDGPERALAHEADYELLVRAQEFTYAGPGAYRTAPLPSNQLQLCTAAMLQFLLLTNFKTRHLVPYLTLQLDVAACMENPSVRHTRARALAEQIAAELTPLPDVSSHTLSHELTAPCSRSTTE